MRINNGLTLVLLLAAGCARVVVIDAEMPPLVPGLEDIQSVGVGQFAATDGTPPHLAGTTAAMLAVEIQTGKRYDLSQTADAAQLLISGEVDCRIAEGTVRRQLEEVNVRTAEVAVTFTGIAGKAMKLFTVVESPTMDDKRALTGKVPNSADGLAQALLWPCVRAFVEDISPRRARVKLPKPGIFGPRHTRRGIALLETDPGEAISELTMAVARNPDDAAALNALGYCSERAGNLDLALSSYIYAAAIDPRDEYRENMERAHDLLARKKRIAGAAGRSKGGAE